jgi:hypothetical protein
MTTAERTRLSRGGVAAWLGIWLVIAGALVLPHTVVFTELSPIDEYQHVDYLDKTLRLEHVNGGEKVDELAMREQACRGVADLDYEPPPCVAESFAPEQFPGLGFNHTFSDPPTYYVVSGPVARLVESVLGLDSIVTAARLVGILWLAAGLLGTFLLARRLGANDWAAAGATLVLASTPVVLGASATVTTDAPELAAGALLTLLAVAVVERRVSVWWLLPGALLVGSFKATSLTVVGMVALFLLIVAFRPASPDGRVDEEADDQADEAVPAGPGQRRRLGRRLLPVGLVIVGGALPLLAWSLVTGATALDSVEDIPAAQMFQVDSIGWAQVANGVRYLLTPVNEAYSAPVLRTPAVELSTLALNVLVIVGVLALAWFGAHGSLATPLARAVTASMVLGGPALVLLIFVTEGVSFGIPGRYGLSLLPAAAACVAVAASSRRVGGPSLVALGVLGMTGVLVALA